MNKFDLETRERLEKRLRRAVPELIWENLEAEGYVRDAGTPEGFDDLLRQAKRYLNVWRGGATRKQVRDRDQRLLPATKMEMQTATTVGFALADRATKDVGVMAFRVRILCGRPLSEREALRFVHSPLLGLCDFGHVGAEGIDLVDHSAEIEAFLADGRDAHFRLRINPGGKVVDIKHRATESDAEMHKLKYAREDGSEVTISVWPDSILADLQTIASRLSTRFGWKDGEASRFVLTGVPPANDPITGWIEETPFGDITRGVIRLEMASWVSADTVKNAYVRLQEMAAGFGKTPRAVGIRSLAVFDFVERRLFEAEGNISFRSIESEWNGLCPESWKYDQDDMKRAYDNACRRLLRPTFGLNRKRATASRYESA